MDVAELLDACVKIEQPAAAVRGHELLLNVSNGNLLHARADRKALRRVLCNLIENAIKYTPDGGRITLSAHLETVSENTAIESNVDEIVISVADTGHGIAPEDLTHVFEKFYRGRASSQAISPNTFEAPYAEPEVPGVGLGLYLARSIINQLDGRITVTSAIGKGSTFTVHLPAWQDVSESIEENIGASDGEAALSR